MPESLDTTQPKIYRLLGPDQQVYDSLTPGQLGGNSTLKIYGRLDCWSANAALTKGYAAIRVFFADEATAIAAGYRPCGHGMQEAYGRWHVGGAPGSADFPWLMMPERAP